MQLHLEQFMKSRCFISYTISCIGYLLNAQFQVEWMGKLVGWIKKTCSTVPFTSLVSVVVMVCTRIGCSLPTVTPPMLTVRVFRLIGVWIASQYFCRGTASTKTSHNWQNNQFQELIWIHSISFWPDVVSLPKLSEFAGLKQVCL